MWYYFRISDDLISEMKISNSKRTHETQHFLQFEFYLFSFFLEVQRITSSESKECEEASQGKESVSLLLALVH